MNTAAFKCKCCGKGTISQSLYAKITMLENWIRGFIPHFNLTIDSGYRCPKHNSEVGGVWDSEHTDSTIRKGISEAVDVDCPDNHIRYLLIIGGYLAGIRRFEDASTWIHLGNDATKPQNVIFRK